MKSTESDEKTRVSPGEPLFASIELARRIERAEIDQLLACVEGLGRRRPALGVVHEALEGGAVTWAGDESPLSKVALVGEGSSVRRDLERADRLLAEIGGAVPIEVCTLADPEVFQALGERADRLVGFEDVLGRRLDTGASADPQRDQRRADPITIERVTPTEIGQWARTMAAGFAVVDVQGVPSHQEVELQSLEALFLDLSETEGMRRYLARRGGEIAGAAGMRLTDGVAQLAGAATLIEHRRRGVQRALLDHRLAEAAGDGCDVAVVTTQPGSTSQHNVQRLGFQKLYNRAVFLAS